uniref:serpin-Z1-like n=1 Tax=Erigeron canadensis TaxID=72917 RepID=UPI001CB8CAB3|nr:serpin-Z1-like [Erigeron canadensis]
MAGERSRKKLKTTIKHFGDSSSIITSAKSSNEVATRILLDDAHNGFKNGNFVCSPFSLDTVMGMLAAGAEGKTLKQLLDFLGHETVDQLLSESPTAILLSQISSDSNRAGRGGPVIGLANSIWVDMKGYKILQIPYESKGQSNDFSMYIFLPDRKDGLQELLQVFHSDPALFQKRFYLKRTGFDELRIPKFKMSCKFDPKDAMEQMGLTLPFNPMNMELNRILESTNSGGADMLYVSKILQKSFIEVDKKGTEAAACTIATMRIGCARQLEPPPPRPRFVADHPFMFMIREDTSMAVLFIGVVLNPHA